MAGVMNDPWGGGAAGGTLQEMLRTGAPTDATGMWNASAGRANQAFEDLMGAGRESRAASGQGFGSGYDAMMGRGSQRIAEEFGARGAEAEFGAAESATGRRLSALQPALAGRQLGLGAASQSRKR